MESARCVGVVVGDGETTPVGGFNDVKVEREGAGKLDADSDSDYVRVESDGGWTMRSSRSNSPVLKRVGSSCVQDVSMGACFNRMCEAMGVDLRYEAKSVEQLEEDDRRKLACVNEVKLLCVVFGEDDYRNHVEIYLKENVDEIAKIAQDLDDAHVTFVKPKMFFSDRSPLHGVKFYADDNENDDIAIGSTSRGVGFGENLPYQSRTTYDGKRPAEVGRERTPSVVDASERGGSSNISGGVVRPKRRNIKNLKQFGDKYVDIRNYTVHSGVAFNNHEEMDLRICSSEQAQEITEELFGLWQLPMSDKSTATFAEHALFAFMIVRTASNKADYSYLLDIPVPGGSVEVNFEKLSSLLMSKYGYTRRQYARGMANRLRDYLKQPENVDFCFQLAVRSQADEQYGYLCFDGSTHCSNLTTSERQFVSVLEGRNLYEGADERFNRASHDLFEGIHGKVRSVVQR